MRLLVFFLLVGCSAPVTQPHHSRPPQAVAAAVPDAPTPDCEAVVTHLTELSRTGVAPRGDDERAFLDDFLAKQAARLRGECAERPWSATYRTCLAAVIDDRELRQCDRDDRIARGADLGGASCYEVGLHFAHVIASEPPPPPHAHTPTTPEQLARNAEALEIVCENAGWSRTVKACMLRATTGDELKTCQHSP